MIPTRTRIKICGLTREQDVDAAVAAGADAVGFVLYERSPRHVAVARMAELARRLPPLEPFLRGSRSCRRLPRGAKRRQSGCARSRCNQTPENPCRCRCSSKR